MSGKRRRLNPVAAQRAMTARSGKRSRAEADAKRALTLARQLMRTREKKFLTTTATTTATSSVVAVSGMAEGDSQDERTGLRISGKRISFKGSVVSQTSDGSGIIDKPVWVHVGLVQDKQQEVDAAPIWARIWDGQVDQGVFKDDIYSTRFRYLRSKWICINPVSGDSKEQCKTIEWNVPLKELEIRFNGSTATDLSKNHLYVTFNYLADDTVNDSAKLVWSTRLTYTDP